MALATDLYPMRFIFFGKQTKNCVLLPAIYFIP